MSPYERDAARPGGLGRLRPSTWTHVEKHPLTAIPDPGPTLTVDTTIDVPDAVRLFYDQGNTGACTGYSSAMLQTVRHLVRGKRVLLDARWPWQWARLHDEWTDNDDLADDEQGTSVHAAYDAWRLHGGRKWTRAEAATPGYAHHSEAYSRYGITANQWATTSGHVRLALAAGEPVCLGINWYSAFDHPVQAPDGDWFIGTGGTLGSIRGGHAIGVYGWRDSIHACAVVNTWGDGYPPRVWMPISVLDRLIREDGEACVVTGEAS